MVLERGGASELLEGREAINAGRNKIFGDSGQVGKKGSKAVNRPIIGGALGRSLQGSFLGTRSGSNDGGSGGSGLVAVMVVEEDGSETLAHMPMDIIGEHAQKDMSADTIGEVVMDGADLQFGALEAAKSALDLGEIFVGEHCLA